MHILATDHHTLLRGGMAEACIHLFHSTPVCFYHAILIKPDGGASCRLIC